MVQKDMVQKDMVQKDALQLQKDAIQRSPLKGDVLVVDDTAANLEVVSQVLEDAGCEVAVALDGDRALKLAQLHPPDLILLDIQMPGIDGFETCRQLKAHPKTVTIPIIFMTALNDADSKIKGFNAGAVDYITKPFQEQELLLRVQTHLRLHRWQQTLECSVATRTQELENTLAQLNQSQLQLVQHEKMSALGDMMSGVAHELNNPLAFIKGSVNHAETYVQDLLEHLELYQQHYPSAAKEIQENREDINLNFLVEDLLKLFTSMKEATQRMKDMSTSLRNFSRADTEHRVSANIQEGIDNTLLILKYRLRDSSERCAIEIVKDYQVTTEVCCFPGQLNQVFMNILANMIDMFDEMSQSGAFDTPTAPSPAITIQTFSQTSADKKGTVIKIRDNGKGMTSEVKERVFDRLFTTKAVGKGTGLGMAIAQQIIVENHQGTLTVDSTIGKGTEFCIWLPDSV